MRKKNMFLILTVLLTGLIISTFIGCAGGGGTYETSTTENKTVKKDESAEKGGTSGTSESSDDSSAAASASAPSPTADIPEEPAAEPSPSGKGESALKESLKSGAEDSGGGIGFLDSEEYAPEPREKSAEGGSSTSAGRTSSTPSSSGLQAGFADDNKQYGYFLGFLDEFADTPHLPLDVSERIVVEVTDKDDKSLFNADVVVKSGGRVLETGKTLTDGRYLFYPSEYPAAYDDFEIQVTAQQETVTRTFTRDAARELPITFNTSRYVADPIPIDILFVMDTTGSMGEEIDRLRTTIELIHLNLTNLTVAPRVRFGMVLYKDIGDEYRTKTIPLTANLDEFQAALALVEASGGGDTPEDLQAALEDSMKRIQWDTEAVKLEFIITDAPPHLDYGQEYSYTDAAAAAKRMGIKIFSVGTGGLSINGEYILRQISQYSAGKYIFLTYGEQGESTGGSAGSVSHHTGSNFQTDKLEAIIIRFAKEELSNLTDTPIEDGESFFVAQKIDDEEREETLNKLFSMALEQLIDYSTIKIDEGTSTALIPVISQEETHNIDAEYFSERLLQQTIAYPAFRVVEREDIQSILDELKLQLSGLTDNTEAVKVGELMHADLIITGTLYRRADEFELFIKLLRVESGEILALTKAKIDKNLGLSGS